MVQFVPAEQKLWKASVNAFDKKNLTYHYDKKNQLTMRVNIKNIHVKVINIF